MAYSTFERILFFQFLRGNLKEIPNNIAIKSLLNIALEYSNSANPLETSSKKCRWTPLGGKAYQNWCAFFFYFLRKPCQH